MMQIVDAPGHCDGCQATVLVMNSGHQREDVLVAAFAHERSLFRQAPLVLRAPIHI